MPLPDLKVPHCHTELVIQHVEYLIKSPHVSWWRTVTSLSGLSSLPGQLVRAIPGAYNAIAIIIAHAVDNRAQTGSRYTCQTCIFKLHTCRKGHFAPFGHHQRASSFRQHQQVSNRRDPPCQLHQSLLQLVASSFYALALVVLVPSMKGGDRSSCVT